MALGDSFTEGLHDEVGPDGRHRGWADRVATALAAHHGEVAYANLAVRGRLLPEVVAEQVPTALDLAPDLVSFHAGGNDLLRPGREVAALLAGYQEAVARLRATGSRLLLFTIVERTGRPGRAAERLARRFAAFNAGVRAVADRHGAALVDVGALEVLRDRRLWHEDRLHLNAHGHERVAAAALAALGVPAPAASADPDDWWRAPLPAPASARRPAALVADVRWVRSHLAPWVWRRLRGVSSGDGVVPKRPTPVVVRAEP